MKCLPCKQNVVTIQLSIKVNECKYAILFPDKYVKNGSFKDALLQNVQNGNNSKIRKYSCLGVVNILSLWGKVMHGSQSKGSQRSVKYQRA